MTGLKKDSDVFWMDPMTVEMLMMAALLQLSPFSVLFWAAFFNKGRKAWGEAAWWDACASC